MAYKGVKQERTLNAGIMSSITVFGAVLSIEYDDKNDTLMQLLTRVKL